jgi:hypothetical protein
MELKIKQKKKRLGYTIQEGAVFRINTIFKKKL